MVFGYILNIIIFVLSCYIFDGCLAGWLPHREAFGPGRALLRLLGLIPQNTAAIRIKITKALKVHKKRENL